MQCGVSHLYSYFCLLILATFLNPESLAQPFAAKGAIELTKIDFRVQESVELSGEWEFHWLKLLEPNEIDSIDAAEYVSFPHQWNQDPELSVSYGYATYGLRVYKPETHPPLALTIPDMYTAYTLYINGVEVAKNGEVAKNKEDYTAFWLPKTIPVDQFKSDTLELVLHISNFRHSKGGIRLPIIIGSFEHLEKARTLELGFTLLLTGCLLMIGLFFLGLYLFGRHEIPMLYFAFVCFFFSYRVFGTELYPLHYLFPSLPWLLTVKAEYFTLYFTPAIFCIFVQQLYPKETSKNIIYTLAGFFSFLSVITLLFPPYYFTNLINLFFMVVPIFVVYVTWIYIKAVQRKREGSGFALASVVIVFIVFLQNLLVYKTILKENLLLDFIGFFSFFFLQSLVLSYRFTNSLSKARIKAEQAAKAKSQFLSIMSHEIRTPLNAVIGLSEILMHTDSEEERKDYATNIKQSGENLLEIINNILDYSKFESVGIEIDYEPLNIKDLVQDIQRLLSPLSFGKALELHSEIENSAPEWIISDATHLKQILINLVGNAIKFTSEGSVSVIVQPNKEAERKGNMKFTITDTGKGISSENIHRLFKSFSRIDASTTREHGGTGLGLVISKKLVEVLGGEIWFDSEVGNGTSFYFTILAEATSKPVSSEWNIGSVSEIQEIKNGSHRVLVVEDNLVNQKVILKMLQNHNVMVDTANNGSEALEKLKQFPYRLIFMDMEMPVMDGIEATKSIRASFPAHKQPVIIAITANAFLEDRERCIEAGMNDYITKPVSIHIVKTVLSKWLQ